MRLNQMLIWLYLLVTFLFCRAVEIYAGLVEDSDDSEGGMDEFDEESDDEPEPNPRPTKKSKN
jgi:hypothetical protein